MNEIPFQEAWKIAFWQCYSEIAKTLQAIDAIGDSIGFFAVQELIAKINWDMCHYCPGDCFGCPEDSYYVCEDCSFSQCDICPYKQFRRNHSQS